MKRVLVVTMVLILFGGFALADIDLSGMSYDELVALKDRINLAIWQSEEWQEVTVPIGVWKVGEDIPVGHWTIKAAPDRYMSWGPVTYNIYSFEDGGGDLQAGRPIETGVGEAQKTIRRFDHKEEWGNQRSTA